ncbi:MAG TPA: hypothetical protein VFB49_10175 [Patescibacteria group bacterium]|nr:hypothetical protein [Patescibacteria group bacterium]
MKTHRARGSWTRLSVMLTALVATAASGVGLASALTYTGGDVLYVAYQYPNGADYIVDLGTRTTFVNATTTITLPDVTASDLNGVIGAAAPNIFVGLFGVLNPTTRDGIVAANGAASDFDMSTANVIGAVNQIDSFGSGVQTQGLAVPSANPRAAKFTSGGSPGSYQSTLDAVKSGSLGNNVQWSVETQLSDAGGARNPQPVFIPFFSTIRNTFTGVQSRAVIGFFTLNPNGTVTYSPDADGDFISDDVDKCPGVFNTDNSDADGDGRAPACDCDPLNGTAWAIPSEIVSLTFSNASSYSWTAPATPGGTVPAYDVLRAPQPSSGVAPSYACFQPNLGVLNSGDGTNPPVGQTFFYLTRAGNSCGEGVAGTRSNGQPVSTPPCP